VSVPGDCVIVGFDDNPFNDWVAPWLNSVRVPYADYGEAMVRAISGKRGAHTSGDAILPHRLVARN